MTQTKNSQKENNQSGHRIISASRRTDIPAFYIDWFMERIRQGFFNVINPYNKVTKKIDARSGKIHTIVFWSKNYGPFLESNAHDELKQMGYNLFFHFSINSDSSMLEPEVPPLKIRLEQLERLCKKNNPKNITWRFDPVCYYKTRSGSINNNLSDFPLIVEKASKLGIQRCITSFADNYRKIGKRVQFLNSKGIDTPSLMDISYTKRVEIIKRMADLLDKKGIKLSLCSEKELFARAFAGAADKVRVAESACISGKLFAELFKGEPDSTRDYGQRSKQGCKCTQSIDIGSYEKHPCFHNCLFCYANPVIDQEMKNIMVLKD